MTRPTAWAWDLILFGLFILAVTVPTYAAEYRHGLGLPPTASYYLLPCFGILLIVLGVFGRELAAPPLRRRPAKAPTSR
jgi:hypothetical protein